MVSKSFITAEKKVIKRGKAYLTPMKHYHIQEFAHIVHPKNKAETKDFGYNSFQESIEEMYDDSEAYVCRNANGDIVFIGGLDLSEDVPHMFSIFANNLDYNVVLVAKMSKSLLNMFDRVHPVITMTILSKNEHMLNWACWLGFEPVEMSPDKKFVEFVRCNFQNYDVNNKSLRPIVH